jgi:hypothetical protein
MVENSFRSRCLSFAALFLVLALILSACGGGDDAPRPTPLPPEIRNATSTASAIIAEQAKAPCVLSEYTRSVIRQVADELWQIGTSFTGKDQGSLGLQFFQWSIAYGLLTECRDVGLSEEGTPVANESRTPVASPVATASPVAIDGIAAVCADPERTIDRLRDAVRAGLNSSITALFSDIPLENLPIIQALNPLLTARADELAVACGFQSPASPVARVVTWF